MSTPTQKEQDFLDAVKAKFENKNDKNPDKPAKHEEMSKLEKRVHDALIVEAEKGEGEMGWSTVKTVINREVNAELKEAEKAHRDSEKTEREVRSTARKTGLGNLVKNTVGGTINKVKDEVQDASYDAKIQRIKTEIDVQEVVTLAQTTGLPEFNGKAPKVAAGKTASAPAAGGDSIETMILKAAQTDGNKELSAKELGALLKDKNFIAAANKVVSGAKFSIVNEPGNGKDTLLIENDDTTKKFALSKINPDLRFEETLKSGELPAQGVGTQQGGGRKK